MKKSAFGTRNPYAPQWTAYGAIHHDFPPLALLFAIDSIDLTKLAIEMEKRDDGKPIDGIVDAVFVLNAGVIFNATVTVDEARSFSLRPRPDTMRFPNSNPPPGGSALVIAQLFAWLHEEIHLAQLTAQFRLMEYMAEGSSAIPLAPST